MCICNLNLKLYLYVKSLRACVQGETPAAGGAVGVPSSSRESQPQLHPSVDQSYGGGHEPL